jgi:hypothetical protein
MIIKKKSSRALNMHAAQYNLRDSRNGRKSSNARLKTSEYRPPEASFYAVAGCETTGIFTTWE